MRDSNKADSLFQELVTRLPQGVGALGDDLRIQLRVALSGALEKLDLVGREEFDVQKAVLQRTREKLAELEAIVAELEGQRLRDRGPTESTP